jgi:hypothetical protein
MTLSPDEILIYSVGDDLQDNSGHIADSAASRDIVVRVRAKKATKPR